MNLAARGLRETMDGRPERIEDPVELATVRAQARRVHVHAAVLGITLTLVSVLLPSW